MVTFEIQYWDIISRYTVGSEIKRTETLQADSEDAAFEDFYKRNNRLRYCNGSYWKFKNSEDETRYNEWLNNIGEQRRFNLYYGGGVVD